MALYVATASVVKVRVGDEAGNGIARIVRRGGVVPADVTDKQIKHLLSINFIKEVMPEVVDVEEVIDVATKATPAKLKN